MANVHGELLLEAEEGCAVTFGAFADPVHVHAFFLSGWIGLLRCGKSCRLRWINYLRPDLKRGNFTAEEEETIIKLHAMLGNKYVRCKQRSDFEDRSSAAHVVLWTQP